MSAVTVATPAFLCLLFAWYIFMSFYFQPILSLKYASCKQYIIGSCFSYPICHCSLKNQCICQHCKKGMSSVIIKINLTSQTPWKGCLVHSLRITAIISISLAYASVDYPAVYWSRLRLAWSFSLDQQASVDMSFSWWHQKFKRSSGNRYLKDLPHDTGQNKSHDQTQSQGARKYIPFL